jgi:predicted patatin/cPLA2 family phospholipase
VSDNRARPGHPVILEILRRAARGRWGGDVWTSDTKLGLVVEGGGMRGVMSGGSLIAMERLGLTSVFDEVYAESAGAINACYFLGGEAAFGGRIYLEDLTSIRFINPMRRGKLLDVDFLVDHVMSRVKPLPLERVLQARSRLFVSLTNVNDGTRRVVDVKKESVPLLTLLKATAAIIPLYNRSVVLDGVPYADGGIADPIPVQNAINNGCTHILVLLTRPPDFVARPYRGLQRLVLGIMLRHWDRRFVDAFFSVRYRRYNEARKVAFGEVAPPPGVELAVICPAGTTPMVTRTTISHRRLKATMDDSIVRTTALFRTGT